MGRDRYADNQPGAYIVSIHAPAWGATIAVAVGLLGSTEFQSTRPHGARLKRSWQIIKLSLFQSTRPHGARLVGLSVSFFSPRFNPRARMGRDGAICKILTIYRLDEHLR